MRRLKIARNLFHSEPWRPEGQGIDVDESSGRLRSPRPKLVEIENHKEDQRVVVSLE
jgi:hypothetical protein